MKIIKNPYEDVTWDEVGFHNFQSHIHTDYGTDHGHNGNRPPHEVVDFYANEGRVEMDIIALTDHQRSVDTTVYPWTEWTALDRIPSDSTYEDRDPAEMGVVAIEGLEVEGNSAGIDQMGGFGCDPVVEYENVREMFETIEEKGGWGWFLHPGRYYDDPDDAWEESYYREFLEEMSSCIGMEIANGVFEHPENEILWDRALIELSPDTTVVGLGADDFHHLAHDERYYPLSWNTVLLSPEEFDPSDQAASRRAIESALRQGRTLFSHVEPENPDALPPELHSLRVSDDGREVTVDVSHCDSIEWISEGEVVGTDATIDVTAAAVGSYVRCKLTKEGEGITWTQALIVGDE